MSRSLAQRMKEDSYDGYAYAYPHKTAYRPLNPPVPLEQAWKKEDKRRLFLYVHLPFCEMRCGFCNLFTTVQPGEGLVEQTLAAIHRQSSVVASRVQPIGIAQAAFGGGTPSFLTEAQLEALFTRLSKTWPVRWGRIPTSFEVSPGTVTREKLALLKNLGVDRISLGVQSFAAEDLISLKRPQPAGELEHACRTIRECGFAVFNIDLIYGNAGQDAKRWQLSLERAMKWQPEELYLYPLYIGKLTHLDRSGKRPAEHRRELYRQAREFLLGRGYRQVSMRLFRRADVVRETDYCCQEDGMVGLGPGARSYTESLHYSTEYAVGQTGVKMILESYNLRNDEQFAQADYGAELGLDEQKLRYVIKSLLRADGVSLARYEQQFGQRLKDDVPQLNELLDLGLAAEADDHLRLNAEGLAWSDTLGPWLYSDAVLARMANYELA
jgi:oxygen-independent coproporphyrinogen III oxidase